MITVLRLGHRPARDKRVTTHVALTARAFGADAILVTTKDPGLERSVRDVVRRFGGSFRIETGVRWRTVLKEWRGTKVHLTMYGVDLKDEATLGRSENLLVVVGAEKVPRDVYYLVDANISVGNQPHSEVAALAIFLDRILGEEARRKRFDGLLEIRQNPRGKTVVDSGT